MHVILALCHAELIFQAPLPNKKHRKDVLTSAINRNIEAMVLQRAYSAGTGLKIVSQHKQAVVKQRRKDLCKTVTNRIVQKTVSKADVFTIYMSSVWSDIDA